MRPTGTIRDIVVGATVCFVPSTYTSTFPATKRDMRRGKIVYVNRDHRFFRVAYETGGYTLHQCFKF